MSRTFREFLVFSHVFSRTGLYNDCRTRPFEFWTTWELNYRSVFVEVVAFVYWRIGRAAAEFTER